MENKQMINALAVLLQKAVQELGPLDDKTGDAIKKIIAEDNLTKIILTGALKSLSDNFLPLTKEGKIAANNLKHF